MFLNKASTSRYKKLWSDSSLCIRAKNVSQIYKILFLAGDINNIFNNKTKSSFSTENKKPAVESERHFFKEAV